MSPGTEQDRQSGHQNPATFIQDMVARLWESADRILDDKLRTVETSLYEIRGPLAEMADFSDAKLKKLGTHQDVADRGRFTADTQRYASDILFLADQYDWTQNASTKQACATAIQRFMTLFDKIGLDTPSRVADSEFAQMGASGLHADRPSSDPSSGRRDL
jgi:hypothetical protein